MTMLAAKLSASPRPSSKPENARGFSATSVALSSSAAGEFPPREGRGWSPLPLPFGMKFSTIVLFVLLVPLLVLTKNDQIADSSSAHSAVLTKNDQIADSSSAHSAVTASSKAGLDDIDSETATATHPTKKKRDEKLDNRARSIATPSTKEEEEDEMQQSPDSSIGSNEDTTNSNDSKKTCVLHIGPPKTASSTLQHFTGNGGKQAMLADNYQRASFKTGSLGHCFIDFDKQMDPTEGLSKKNSRCKENPEKIKDEYMTFLSDSARDGHNVFISAEAYSRPQLNVTAFTDYIVPHFNIHVIVVYRRFYDWIFSYYNQIVKINLMKFVKRHPDLEVVDLEALSYFVEWLTSDRIAYFRTAHTTAAARRYRSALPDAPISVINMHENPEDFDIASRVFCESVDNAPHTCKVAKAEEAELRNPSISLDWDLFRIKIQQHHTIRLSQTDKRWKSIEEEYLKMTDAPKICVSAEMKKELLDLSLELEVATTDEEWYNSDAGLKSLKADFEDKIASKMCSIDAQKILTSSHWQAFLTLIDGSEGDSEGES